MRCAVIVATRLVMLGSASMKILIRLVLVLIVLGLAGGAGYLAFVDTHAPRKDVEIVVPNDRFKP